MKPIQYPDSDQALAAAIRRGDTQLHTTITVHRPWQTDSSDLQPRYLLDPQTPGRTSAELNGLRIPLDRPLELLPVRIAKPWGEEIWYSGIEARGESHVSVEGGSLPLLDYLSLAPARLCGRTPVILLKHLSSKPEPVVGELYFEIHRRKSEVYVVTDVDAGLYPDGAGTVNFGVNQEKRRQFPDDAAFRRAFLAAVQVCESQQECPSGDDASRRHMLSFVASVALRPGDSLMVPPGVPHSLQPGLQVIEFQTPEFERRIIYASQPVVTQSGWDSASAIADMCLDAAPGPRPADHPDQLIAAFPEFSVSRIHLECSQPEPLPAYTAYALSICLAGAVRINCAQGSLTLQPGSAAFIPGSAKDVSCLAIDSSAQLLVAAPGA